MKQRLLPVLLVLWSLAALCAATAPLQAQPDLTITSLTVSDATGPSITWSATVKNQGNQDATSQYVTLRIYIVDGGFVQMIAGYAKTTGLTVGESYTFARTNNLTGLPNNGINKFYDFLATVDPDDVYDESNENNNDKYAGPITLIGDAPVTPTITQFAPSSGAAGSSVTISGTNFGATKGSSTLKFGSTTATTSSWSNTSITATVPSIASATYTLVVTTSQGSASSSSGFSVTVPQTTTITTISPTQGVAGSRVTLTGTNFGSTQGSGFVEFGTIGVNRVRATIVSWSNTSITLTVPPTLSDAGYVIYLTTGTNDFTTKGTFTVSSGLASVRFATIVLGFSSEFSNYDWSAQRALGAPDIYPTYEDHTNAWASLSADDSREYLELGFANPAPITKVSVYEVFKPGAIDTVYVKNPGTNRWQVVWSGTAVFYGDAARIFEVTFPQTSFNVNMIRLALNSPAVGGWNEIDAVSISGPNVTAVRTDDGAAIPAAYALEQNYPNPFNPITHLRFTIADFRFVTLKVYNILGEEVATLLNEETAPGSYTLPWDATGVPSGVYYYRLTAGEFTDVKKMLLVR